MNQIMNGYSPTPAIFWYKMGGKHRKLDTQYEIQTITKTLIGLIEVHNKKKRKNMFLVKCFIIPTFLHFFFSSNLDV